MTHESSPPKGARGGYCTLKPALQRQREGSKEHPKCPLLLQAEMHPWGADSTEKGPNAPTALHRYHVPTDPCGYTGTNPPVRQCRLAITQLATMAALAKGVSSCTHRIRPHHPQPGHPTPPAAPCSPPHQGAPRCIHHPEPPNTHPVPSKTGSKLGFGCSQPACGCLGALSQAGLGHPGVLGAETPPPE